MIFILLGSNQPFSKLIKTINIIKLLKKLSVEDSGNLNSPTQKFKEFLGPQT